MKPGLVAELDARFCYENHVTGPFFCMACGELCTLVSPAESSVYYPNGRKAHFKHEDAALCDIQECEKRVADYLEGKGKVSKGMPLYLKKNAKTGTYELAVGFPTIPKEMRDKLASLGYLNLSIMCGKEEILKVPLDTFASNSETTYCNLPGVIQKHAHYGLFFTGKTTDKFTRVTTYLPDWMEELDTFSKFGMGAIFEKPENGTVTKKVTAGEKVTGGNKPYLVAVKKTASVTVDELAKEGLIEAKKVGSVTFREKGISLYLIYQVSFPDSSKLSPKNYIKLADWTRRICGNHLVDQGETDGNDILLRLGNVVSEKRLHKYAKAVKYQRKEKYKKF